MSTQGKSIYLDRAATSTPTWLDALVSGGCKVIGARGHAGYGIFPFIMRLLANGKLGVDRVITSRYLFQKVLEALRVSVRVRRVDRKILVKM